jgi:hypothetical protein
MPGDDPYKLPVPMLIRFYRSSYAAQYVSLFLLAVVLWAGAFWRLSEPVNDSIACAGPLYHILMNFTGGIRAVSILLAFFLLLFEAVLLNLILINNDLVPRNNLVPTLVYILLMSSTPGLLMLHPALVANLFFLITLHMVFKLYSEAESYPRVFNTGMMLALASLFYLPSAIFLVFVWMTFLVYRLFSWREWLIILIGFLLPYVYLLSVYFFLGRITEYTDALVSFLRNFEVFPEFGKLERVTYISSGFIVFFLAPAVLRLMGEINEKIVATRKRFWAVIWFLIISVGWLPFSGSFFILHLPVIYLPVTVFLAWYFSAMKKTRRLDILFTVWVLLIAANNLFGILD